MDSTQDTPQQEVRLIDVSITDENIALNVIVSFLNVAQKRGTFSIAESAKIFECIQKFIQQAAAPPMPMSDEVDADEVPPPSEA
jgi:hypothetical protein